MPPSSYLRMSPECTPRMSPSMFLRWTTSRRSATERRRMTSPPRPGCSPVTRWSLGPPAASSWHRGQEETQPTSQEGGEMATAVIGRITERLSTRNILGAYHRSYAPSPSSSTPSTPSSTTTTATAAATSGRSPRSQSTLLTSYKEDNLTRTERISVPALLDNYTMKPFAKDLRGFMAGPAVQCPLITAPSNTAQ